MDEWPPGGSDEEEDERAAPEERPVARERDPFSAAVGEAWESGLRRDPYPDGML